MATYRYEMEDRPQFVTRLSLAEQIQMLEKQGKSETAELFKQKLREDKAIVYIHYKEEIAEKFHHDLTLYGITVIRDAASFASLN
jgi:ABC-type molybdenum transport system ATPase subunit/photorepair protein PhrA